MSIDFNLDTSFPVTLLATQALNTESSWGRITDADIVHSSLVLMSLWAQVAVQATQIDKSVQQCGSQTLTCQKNIGHSYGILW